MVVILTIPNCSLRKPLTYLVLDLIIYIKGDCPFCTLQNDVIKPYIHCHVKCLIQNSDEK